MRRQWTGMRGVEHVVTRLIHEGRFFLCVSAPQQEHDIGTVGRYPANHRICQLLPALVFVRVGATTGDGEHSIEQQHALLGPARQVTVVRPDKTGNIGAQLLVHVGQ